MRPLLATLLSLWLCDITRAQVLDDQLEFENHVAAIELTKDSPVLEEIGLSREITYECDFEGTLFLSVMADAGVDPYLRVEDQEGNGILEAWLRCQVGLDASGLPCITKAREACGNVVRDA